MEDEEKNTEYKRKQLVCQRSIQSIKRLCEQIGFKGKTVKIDNVTDAVSFIQSAYQFLLSKKVEATKVILNTVIEMETANQMIEMETANRIPRDQEEDRDSYVDFMASEIINSCKCFTGNTSQIRFHPIMINLAMNLYTGMKYKEMVDVSPFVFPTVQTIQRHQAKVATHEGTDPKVYARVSKMAGFKTEVDMLIHWMFDKVKLTSGVMWNATNDDFRGLCCGTSSNLEDLKDLLDKLYDHSDNGGGRDGIYCNQWLARNPFGTTLVGKFFYNEATCEWLDSPPSPEMWPTTIK